MTNTTQTRLNNSLDAIAEMLTDKVHQAMANGATEDQAIVAVRQLLLDYLKEA